MRTRAGRLVLAWCALYTFAAPEAERARRRAEIAAHIFDATEVWGSGARSRLRLTRDCVRGAADDLAWCNVVRREDGMSNLFVEMVLGQAGATLIAGVSMVAAFVFSLSDGAPFAVLRGGAVAVAAWITGASFADRLIQRWLARKRA